MNKFRVEICYATAAGRMWVILNPDACGYTLAEARRVARQREEHERYYARFGARIDPVRVVRESDGAVVS